MIETEGECAEWTFPAELDTVRSARHVVRETLLAWDLDAALADVTVLLVSELVTNSMRYTAGPIGLRLSLRPGDDGPGRPDPVFPPPPALMVEVSDPLPDPPLERPAGPDDEGGRGLQLVACSARRWGTRKGRAGKTVWFELALPG